MKGLNQRLFIILFVALFCAYLLIPSVLKFGFGERVSAKPTAEDPWYHKVLPAEVLRLGLDLRGGLHLVLGVDFEEVRQSAIQKLSRQMEDVAKQENVDGITVDVTNNDLVRVRYPNDATWEKFESALNKTGFASIIDFESQDSKQALLRLSATRLQETRTQALDQVVETLRNRIDEFGIAEPIITKLQEQERVLVQFPGVQETGRLKDIISRTAKLSFQIVRTSPDIPNGFTREGDDKPVPSFAELQAMVAAFEAEKGMKPSPTEPISEYLKALNNYVRDKIPTGMEILFQKDSNINTGETEYTPYLLERQAMVTGEDLQDARQGFDPQTNEPEVNFELTPTGATKFEEATGLNVGQLMAIVLDNNVHSAPSIRERIGGGRARIQMGGLGKNPEEVATDARDTALVLRSGALPARLLFLEERVIGPSLGKQAIEAGTRSLLVGLTLVLTLMILYYRATGVVAAFALTFNGLIVFAVLAAFEGTLTLPGLAGLALTLGMAVDANVLIFEHMREELRSGKSVNLSIAEGYQRAFSAILDGNLTTLIAAFVLLQFGYGPIRGFAVTLIIGVVGSVFTALYVTRFIFDYFVVSKGRKTLSI